MVDQRSQPYVVRQSQNWAVLNERRVQNEVLYRFGEYSIFVMMWDLSDFEKGYVRRCSKCYVAYGKVAEAYKQAANNNCTDCFGTTFEGGYRAKVVRPTIWVYTKDDEDPGRRGVVDQTGTTLQTTSDIRLHDNDFIFRADGTRWEIQQSNSLPIHTGFGRYANEQLLANLSIQANKLNTTDTGFLIGPDTPTVIAALNVVSFAPSNFSAIEDIRGPLSG
jgi:hypothetical protein